MIRISSNYMVQRYQRDLNAINYEKSKLMEQSDGSKLHRPSLSVTRASCATMSPMVRMTAIRTASRRGSRG